MGASCSPSPFPGGAALLDGSTGWVLVGERAASSLGWALAWAHRAEVADLHVVADDEGAAGTLARQATAFAPAPSVWRADGTALVPADAAPAEAPAPPPDAPELRALLVAAGLDVVDEAGVTLGEVRGLEVARIARGDDGRPHLGVGIGRFDREVAEMTMAHLPLPDRLARVAELVAGHRRPGAPSHPLNQLVPERWLRATLVADPARVGATALRPVPSVAGRASLREVGTAAALGTGPGGELVLVVCSTGADVALVPSAADDRGLHAPEARLVLAVPARDALPVTRALAARLALPADVLAVEGDWRTP